MLHALLVLLGIAGFTAMFIFAAAIAAGYHPRVRRAEGNAENPLVGVCINCGKPTYAPRRLCLECTETVTLLWALGEKWG